MNAVEAFSASGHPYNCAQSVAVGAGREDLVPELAACGGGRAPEGLCGALHTALLLAPPEKREAIRAQFQVGAGALRCHEIKGGTHFPCAECVSLAAKLLAEAQNED